MFLFRMGPRRAPQRNEEEPPPPPSLAQVFATMETNRVRTEQILERLVQNQNNNQNRQGQCVSLADFLRVGPPFFSNPKEPLDADDWLRSVQRKFAAHHVPAAEHVNFATYLLEGPAGVWWDGVLALQAPGHVVTWDEFHTVFREKYIPKTVMDGMRKKFQSLTQGKMDIEAYAREFTRLSRYAPRDVVDDADKHELFRKGMNPELRYQLLAFTYPNFQALLNQATVMPPCKVSVVC